MHIITVRFFTGSVKRLVGHPVSRVPGSSVSTATENRGSVPRYINARYTEGSEAQIILKLADYAVRGDKVDEGRD